jgi:hypothetical protein
MTIGNKKAKPLSPVITLPEPEATPVRIHGEKGGTIQWRTDSPRFPRFEVTFKGENPSNDKLGETFPGADDEPVVVRLAKIGDFSCTIKHFKPDGSSVDGEELLFSVVPCTHC